MNVFLETTNLTQLKWQIFAADSNHQNVEYVVTTEYGPKHSITCESTRNWRNFFDSETNEL